MRLCALSDVIVQLPQLRQGPYAAWRRRQTAETGAYPQSFAQVVQSVVSFADPLLTGQTDGPVWDAAVRDWQPGPHR